MSRAEVTGHVIFPNIWVVIKQGMRNEEIGNEEMRTRNELLGRAYLWAEQV